MAIKEVYNRFSQINWKSILTSRRNVTFFFITIIAIIVFAFLTFSISFIASRAAGDGLVHIEPESSAGSSQVLSDSNASGGKFIRFRETGSTPSTAPSATKAPTATKVPSAPTATKAPTAKPTVQPTTGPTATLPPVQTGKGIWISKEEIMALEPSGSAWDAIESDAKSSWGSADLSDNNSSHDVKTLAGAIVAVRNGDEAMRQKTIQGLQSAMNSKLARALELSRGLQTYIIAADIIGYRTPAFEKWVTDMIEADVQGHTCQGVIGTAECAANNWGGHARASYAAAAVYLNRTDWLQNVATAHKAFIGAPAPGNRMKYTSTNWHAGSPQAGVNATNATKSGVNLSGVLTEDWRRGGEFKWPPSVSGYMWEGMQGYVVTAVILHRANLVPFNAGENAVVRSMDMLYGTGTAASNSPVFKNPASSDDTWIPWVVNYYAGTNYPTTSANSGKNMGFTDWTHNRVQGASDSQVLAANTNCPQVPSGLSTSTLTVDTPAGVYKVWSRMKASTSGADSYWLQIDDDCPVLVGNANKIGNSWTWINYINGSQNSSLGVPLTEGKHTFTLMGNEVGTDVDKILLTQNVSCSPEEFGENCAIRERAENVIVESESGSKNGVSVQSDTGASGGKYVLFGEGGPVATNPTATKAPSATKAPTANPQATITPTKGAPTPTTVLPPPSAQKGIWISKDQIQQLPMSGSAWSALKSAADNAKADGADISNQDSSHDVTTLAAALVCVRLPAGGEKDQMCSKARSAVVDAIDTESGGRWLAVGRNLGAYVIAADLLDLRSGYHGSQGTQVQAWLEKFYSRTLQHNNDSSKQIVFREAAWNSASNASAQEGFAYAALAAYLGRQDGLEWSWNGYRRYAGDRTSPHKMTSNDDSWQQVPSDVVAIQNKGATKNNCRLDGAISNDMSRGGSFSCTPGYTQYPWVGLEGAVPAALVLHRAGYPAFSVADNAILRSFDYLWEIRQKTGKTEWFDGSRADETIQIVNVAYSKDFYMKNSSTGGGRTVGFTDWTHPNSIN